LQGSPAIFPHDFFESIQNDRNNPIRIEESILDSRLHHFFPD
jgi:hypothetical protein